MSFQEYNRDLQVSARPTGEPSTHAAVRAEILSDRVSLCLHSDSLRAAVDDDGCCRDPGASDKWLWRHSRAGGCGCCGVGVEHVIRQESGSVSSSVASLLLSSSSC